MRQARNPLPYSDDRWRAAVRPRLAAACEPYGLLVRFLAYTGLRWREATALRVGRLVAHAGSLGPEELAFRSPLGKPLRNFNFRGRWRNGPSSR